MPMPYMDGMGFFVVVGWRIYFGDLTEEWHWLMRSVDGAEFLEFQYIGSLSDVFCNRDL